ncbi:KilA-N domain-containing protein [Escherichia coli]|nr:KilA-N domain-containing protein [Escherichia coli]EIQ9245752.1 KilA-N domain-containing protein [Escherichia coli]
MNTTKNEIAAPVICGVEIAIDDEGRYNLNNLHAAAMAQGKATESQRPGAFLQSRQVKNFVQVLTDATKIASTLSIKGGTNQGTWGLELVAIRYAAWLSPEFEIEVYQTFLDYRTGKLTAPQTTNSVGINEALLQELLLQMRENQEYQRREITILRSELAQLKADRIIPMSAVIDQQLLRERNELAERLGQSRNYATLDAVERKMGREYQWHRLRNWCLRNNVEPLVLRKFQCVHAWPRGAWLDVYGVDLEELFG